MYSVFTVAADRAATLDSTHEPVILQRDESPAVIEAGLVMATRPEDLPYRPRCLSSYLSAAMVIPGYRALIELCAIARSTQAPYNT